MRLPTGHQASKLAFGRYETDYAISESKAPSSVMGVLMRVDVAAYGSLAIQAIATMPN